jgi:hypothetical protein
MAGLRRECICKRGTNFVPLCTLDRFRPLHMSSLKCMAGITGLDRTIFAETEEIRKSEEIDLTGGSLRARTRSFLLKASSFNRQGACGSLASDVSY